MPFEKSAGAVVYYRNPDGKIEYLLLHHGGKWQDRNYWNFPKGNIEKRETEIEAAKREIQEETGLKDLEIMVGFKAREKYFYREPRIARSKVGGRVIFKTIIFYLAESKNKKIKLSSEHQGFEWLDFESSLERVKKFKSSQEILKKANDFLQKNDRISKKRL